MNSPLMTALTELLTKTGAVWKKVDAKLKVQRDGYNCGVYVAWAVLHFAKHRTLARVQPLPEGDSLRVEWSELINAPRVVNASMPRVVDAFEDDGDDGFLIVDGAITLS